MTELERFSAPIRAEFEEAGQRLDDLLSAITRNSALPDLYARYVDPPVRHLFLAGGKLLRPLLVLLSARAVGELAPTDSPAVVRAAAAVELIHTASLAHDDLVDSSCERRGVPSLHAAFSPTTAVLIGDLFYSRFFQELAGLPGTSPGIRVRLLDTFLAVTARMCEGEILEEQMKADGREPSFEEYLHVTGTKTADLVSACCRAGALLNGAQEGAVEALAGYGGALGLLFQIADDLADGDAAFTNRPLLAMKADECSRTAESLISVLPRNEASAALRELPGHILSPISRR
ncbi:MAG: polyprenyl synthetase family protein [Spirochaetia bacterium]|jgi:geranylgeranyl pyrophosphate synthase